jgi:hypothetical protein
MYNEIYVIILHWLHGGGARGHGFIVIGILGVQLCQLPHEVIFLLGHQLFVSLLDVLLLLGLTDARQQQAGHGNGITDEVADER